MLKPTKDWIVTKPIEVKDTETISGILIPNMYQAQGVKLVELVSFGPGVDAIEELKAGDVVMVPSTTGLPIDHEGTKYEMAKAENFLGMME